MFKKLADHANEIFGYNKSTAAFYINWMQRMRTKTWGGSCYGFSVATMLDKAGKVGFNENFGLNARTMHDVVAPPQNLLPESAINYYQMSWTLVNPGLSNGWYCYSKADSDWKDGMRKLVDVSKAGKPVMFIYQQSYNGNDGGHAIVIKGYEEQADGSHNVVAYDNRSPGYDTIIKIPSDYSSCTVITPSTRESVVRTQFINDVSIYDSIDLDGSNNYYTKASKKPSKKAALPSGKTLILIGLNDNLTIKNSRGESLTVNNGSYSGSMSVSDVCICPNSTATNTDSSRLQFSVNASDAYSFSSATGKVNVTVIGEGLFADANVTGANSVTVSKTNGVAVNGSNIKYDIAYGINNNVCDMVSANGDTKTNLKLDRLGNDIEITGADTSGGKVTVFSNYTDASTYSYTDGYSSILITPQDTGKSGAVEIRGSSKNNGIYDVDLKTGKVTTDPTKDTSDDKDQSDDSSGETATKPNTGSPNTVADIKLSYSETTYNGDEKNPSVVVRDAFNKVVTKDYYDLTYADNINVGIASVRLDFKSPYSGSITKRFKIRPQGTTLLSKHLYKRDNSKIRIKIKAQKKQTSGYELKYSAKRSLSGGKKVKVRNNTAYKVLTGLKENKKYYIIVRTYKNISHNGKKKTLYSKWSKKYYFYTAQ